VIARALIAEDEAPQRAELRRLLAELWPELQVVAECEDGLSALEAIEAHRPQIVFLDIRMPGLSGLELARSVSGSSRIVFTTAYDEYAVEAFDRGAIDYLLKPIRRERLAETLRRLREGLGTARTQDWPDVLDALQKLMSPPRSTRIRWITASSGNTTKLFAIEDVLYFKAEEKYTRVVTSADSAYVRMSLKELIAGLDSNEFWQVHRSVVVRASAIRSIRRGDDGRLTLQLKTGSEELPISSAFQHLFRGM
jgi:DNA-binding LytR/AlgR family response regulator